jgi:hypothetical protein
LGTAAGHERPAAGVGQQAQGLAGDRDRFDVEKVRVEAGGQHDILIDDMGSGQPPPDEPEAQPDTCEQDQNQSS